MVLFPQVTGLISSSAPWETQVCQVMGQHPLVQPQKLRATSQLLTVLLPVDPKNWSPHQEISASILADNAQLRTKVTRVQAQEALSQGQARPEQILDSFSSRSNATGKWMDKSNLTWGPGEQAGMNQGQASWGDVPVAKG